MLCAIFNIPHVTYASEIDSRKYDHGVLMLCYKMFSSGCKYPFDIPRKH